MPSTTSLTAPPVHSPTMAGAGAVQVGALLTKSALTVVQTGALTRPNVSVTLRQTL